MSSTPFDPFARFELFINKLVKAVQPVVEELQEAFQRVADELARTGEKPARGKRNPLPPSPHTPDHRYSRVNHTWVTPPHVKQLYRRRTP